MRTGARLSRRDKRDLTIAYLHTIEGRPAYYNGQYICYAENQPNWQDHYEAARLCMSIEQMEAEQSASRDWREKHGFDTSGYGYVVVGF